MPRYVTLEWDEYIKLTESTKRSDVDVIKEMMRVACDPIELNLHGYEFSGHYLQVGATYTQKVIFERLQKVLFNQQMAL